MNSYGFFISHSSEEKELIALPIYKKLSSYGFSCWLDSHMIRSGDEIFDNIKKIIPLCTCFITVFSNNFMLKRWPQHELQIAHETGGNHIIPILYNIDSNEVFKQWPLLEKKAYQKVDITNDKWIDEIISRIIGKYYKLLDTSCNTYYEDSIVEFLYSNIADFDYTVKALVKYFVEDYDHPSLTLINSFNIISYSNLIINSKNDNANLKAAYAYVRSLQSKFYEGEHIMHLQIKELEPLIHYSVKRIIRQ